MQTQRNLGGSQLQSTHLSSKHGSSMGQRVVYPRAPQHVKKRSCRTLPLSEAQVLTHAQLERSPHLVLLFVDKPLDPPVSVPAGCSQPATTSPTPIGGAAEDSAWGAPACASLTAMAGATCAGAVCTGLLCVQRMLHTQACRGMLLR